MYLAWSPPSGPAAASRSPKWLWEGPKAPGQALRGPPPLTCLPLSVYFPSTLFLPQWVEKLQGLLGELGGEHREVNGGPHACLGLSQDLLGQDGGRYDFQAEGKSKAKHGLTGVTTPVLGPQKLSLCLVFVYAKTKLDEPIKSSEKA